MESLSGDLHLAKRNFMHGVLENRNERFCPPGFEDIKIAPLSIIYNGKLAIFDVRSYKVDEILKFAESSKQQTLSQDVLTTRKSSVRFLEKRQERMTMVSPYGFPHAAPENKK
nr:protein TIFY 9-like [Solanum lycopersicum]